MVTIKGDILSKKVVLDNPETYRDKKLLIVEIDDGFVSTLLEWVSNKDNLTNVSCTLDNWGTDWSSKAKKYFYFLRDRLAQAQGDTTREAKDLLKAHCLVELDAREANGDIKKSFSRLTKKELWEATQIMERWVDEAGGYKADLRDQRAYLQGAIDGR